jgi:hypothetical protein
MPRDGHIAMPKLLSLLLKWSIDGSGDLMINDGWTGDDNVG